MTDRFELAPTRPKYCARRSGGRADRLPCREHRVHCAGFRESEKVLAEWLVGEHLREFGKDIEMLLRGLLGDQQEEQQPYGATVGCIEWDGFSETYERSNRFLEPFDPSVRNRNALTEPRGTKPF